MSRRSHTRPTAPERPVQPVRDPALLRLVRSILGLPRLARVIMVAVFALAVTFALSPMVDVVYLHYFYDDSTVIIPSLISAGAGLLMYMLGWVLIVGTVDEEIPARLAILWYGGLGSLAVILVLIMLMIGWVNGNA
ncbi:MAG: hypothetical protein HXY41_08220 [Chloroflexi bacterium]|nr:hypothetical protein [Chloroflexota bacterium]